MNNKPIGYFVGITILFFFSLTIKAQDTKFNSTEIINLALANQKQLKVANYAKEVAKSKTLATKNNRLPTIGLSATAAYLGDAEIFDTSFSHVSTKDIPSFGNSFALSASELLYKGGAINKTIQMAELNEQLADLDYTTNVQAVKFLVLSNYLDIYRLRNQQDVYLNNKDLANQRLDNVKKFYKQDLVTKNEVLSSELAIQSIEQGILTVANSLSIVNFNLTTAIGLTHDITIVPVEELENKLLDGDLAYYLMLAKQYNPSLQKTKTSIDLADKRIAIAKTDYLPSLQTVAGYNITRPITTATPVLDMYSNTYQIGLSLNYSIDNVLKAKQKIKTEQLAKEQADEAKQLIEQQVDMQINSAYTKYYEAIQNAKLAEKSKELAVENYRIVEAKYLNQLAIQADMTFASNAKLEAELACVNAQINILFQYYSLQKAVGTL